jgi:hypothetical protein
MPTPTELERAMSRALSASDEGALWLTAEALVEKGTPLALVGALTLTLRYIEANRGSLDVAESARILDRFEELVSA